MSYEPKNNVSCQCSSSYRAINAYVGALYGKYPPLFAKTAHMLLIKKVLKWRFNARMDVWRVSFALDVSLD